MIKLLMCLLLHLQLAFSSNSFFNNSAYRLSRRNSTAAKTGYTICLKEADMQSVSELLLINPTALKDPLIIFHCNATTGAQAAQLETIPNVNVVDLCGDVDFPSQLSAERNISPKKISSFCPLFSLLVSPFQETAVLSQLHQLNLTQQSVFNKPEYLSTGALIIREKMKDLINSISVQPEEDSFNFLFVMNKLTHPLTIVILSKLLVTAGAEPSIDLLMTAFKISKEAYDSKKMAQVFRNTDAADPFDTLKVCTNWGTANVTAQQVNGTDVLLTWYPNCIGQLWQNSSLLKYKVASPVIIDGLLLDHDYFWMLMGAKSWVWVTPMINIQSTPLMVTPTVTSMLTPSSITALAFTPTEMPTELFTPSSMEIPQCIGWEYSSLSIIAGYPDSATLIWNQSCYGQLYQNGQLVSSSIQSPYIATGLRADRSYVWTLHGLVDWVWISDPYFLPSAFPTASPTPPPQCIGWEQSSLSINTDSLNSVTLTWNPNCYGQMYENGQLINSSVMSPYTITDLRSDRNYIWTLRGLEDWVWISDPYVVPSSLPSSSPSSSGSDCTTNTYNFDFYSSFSGISWMGGYYLDYNFDNESVIISGDAGFSQGGRGFESDTAFLVGDFKAEIDFLFDESCVDPGIAIFPEQNIWNWGPADGRISAQVNCGNLELVGTSNYGSPYDVYNFLSIGKWYKLAISSTASSGFILAQIYDEYNVVVQSVSLYETFGDIPLKIGFAADNDAGGTKISKLFVETCPNRFSVSPSSIPTVRSSLSVIPTNTPSRLPISAVPTSAPIPMSDTTICCYASEDDDCVLTCPSNQIISVVNFASYGTSYGTCGSYNVGWCHASTTSAVVESDCTGVSSCVVRSSNLLFGDPCDGVMKHLNIQATCADDNRESEGPTSSPTIAPVTEFEKYDALCDIYDLFKDNNWWVCGWDCENGKALSSPCMSHWDGVHCYYDEVYTIYLGGYGLEGNIPESIGTFDHLVSLDLSNNQLNGSIPTSLYNINSLQYLYLSNNQITSAFSDSSAHSYSLFYVDLSNNFITGDVNTFCNFTNLYYLYAYSNDLECYDECLDRVTVKNIGAGKCYPPDSPTPAPTISPLDYVCDIYSTTDLAAVISSSGWIYGWNCEDGKALTNPCSSSTPWYGVYCSLGTVYQISISMGINGTLPESWGYISTLQYIYLGYNKFHGSIPESWLQMNSLYSLALNDNEFSDNGLLKLLFENGSSLTSLTSLDLRNNQIEGKIPNVLDNSLSSLSYLYLSDNQLSGIIPSSLCNLPLWGLETIGNNLDCYDACINDIYMYQKRLGCGICVEPGYPTASPTLSPANALCDLYYSTNMAELKSQGRLYGWDCESRATIDPCSSGGWSSWTGVYCNWNYEVYYLYLSYIGLEGYIPASISTLYSLEYFIAAGNSLNSTIPDSVWTLPRLYYFDVTSNQFEGALNYTICDSSVKYLYTSNNDFSCYDSCIDSMALYGKNMDSGYCPNGDPVILPKQEKDYLCDLYNSTNMNTLRETIYIYGWDCVGDRAQTDPCMYSWTGVSCDYIYSSYTYSYQVSSIVLRDMGIDGFIPSNIGMLQHLRMLDLSYNNFTGIIPESVKNLTVLTELHLQQNSFIGSIPIMPVSMYYLDLSNNLLTGKLSSNLCENFNLYYLFSYGNYLTCYDECIDDLNIDMSMSSLGVESCIQNTVEAGSFYCPAYTAEATNSALNDYVTCSFDVCPGLSITASLCDSFASADPYLRLYDDNGNELVSNDDYCSLNSHLYYEFAPSSSSYCSKFHLRQGCWSSGSCGGEVKITIANLPYSYNASSGTNTSIRMLSSADFSDLQSQRSLLRSLSEIQEQSSPKPPTSVLRYNFSSGSLPDTFFSSENTTSLNNMKSALPIGIFSTLDIIGDVELSMSFYNKMLCTDLSLILYKNFSTWYWEVSKDVIKLQITCGYLALHGQQQVLSNFETGALRENEWYTLHLSHKPSINETFVSIHDGNDTMNTLPLLKLGPLNDALLGHYKFGFNARIPAQYLLKAKTAISRIKSKGLERDVSLKTNNLLANDDVEESDDNDRDDSVTISGITLSYTPISQDDTETSTAESSSIDVLLVSSLVATFSFLTLAAIAYFLYRRRSITEKVDPNDYEMSNKEKQVFDDINPIFNIENHPKKCEMKTFSSSEICDQIKNDNCNKI